MDASSMASIMTLPREGHSKAVFNFFSFLQSEYNGVTVFDPNKPEIDKTQFPTEYWSVMNCGTCKEHVPPNASSPRGIGFMMRGFLDSNHAGDSITCLSRTRFIVFLNNTPVFVHSKKQESCEISSFSYDFIAMKS